MKSTAATTHNLPFSEAIPHGDILYISGQVGIDPATGALDATSFGSEAERVMKNLGRILGDHHLQYSDLVNVTIYLTDMGNYKELNGIYEQYFTSGYPARVCIAVKELPLGARVEISAMARLSASRK